MKKIMTMVVAALLATVSVNAQQEVGTFTIQPHIGGSAGMIINADNPPIKDLSGSKPDKDANGGGLIGVELEYQLANKLSLAAGVNYLMAGSAWKEINHRGVKYKDMKVETQYVAVPVVANFYLFRGFAIKSGVQFAFLTDAKTKWTREVESGNITNKTEFSESCKDALNKFELSIPVGISYEFKVPIVIDFRYNIGLTKINDNPLFGNESSRAHSATLTVGYKFKL